MPDNNAAQPTSALLPFFYTGSALACIAAVMCVYWYGLKDGSWAPTSLADSKVTVTASDMLGTEITLSGITVPLAIAYLLAKEKELQINTSEKVVFYLAQNGIKLESFRSACLTLANKSVPQDPTDCLSSLEEFVGLGSHEDTEELTERGALWLLPDAKLRAHYSKLFARNTDRKTIETCIALVGVPAFFCFFDMYLRFSGFRSWQLDFIEVALLVFTALANFFTYFVLYRILSLKTKIKKQAGAKVKKACAQVRSEIASALAHARAVGAREEANLTADIASATTPKGH